MNEELNELIISRSYNLTIEALRPTTVIPGLTRNP